MDAAAEPARLVELAGTLPPRADDVADDEEAGVEPPQEEDADDDDAADEDEDEDDDEEDEEEEEESPPENAMQTFVSSVLPHLCYFAFFVLLLAKLESPRALSWAPVFAPVLLADVASLSRRAFASRREDHTSAIMFRSLANGLDSVGLLGAKVAVMLRLLGETRSAVFLLLTPFWIATGLSALVRGGLGIAAAKAEKQRGNNTTSSSSSNTTSEEAAAAAAEAPPGASSTGEGVTPTAQRAEETSSTEPQATAQRVNNASCRRAVPPAQQENDDQNDPENPPERDETNDDEHDADAQSPHEQHQEEEEEDNDDDDRVVSTISRSASMAAFARAAAAHVLCRGLEPFLVSAKLDDRFGLGRKSWGLVFAPCWAVLGLLACVAATLCNCAPLLSHGMPSRVRQRAVKLVSLCATQLLVLSSAAFVSLYYLSRRLDAADRARDRYHRRRDDLGCDDNDTWPSHDNATITRTDDACAALERDLPDSPTAVAILAPVLVMYATLFVLHPIVVKESKDFQRLVRLVVDDAAAERRDSAVALASLEAAALASAQHAVGAEDEGVVVEAIVAPTRLLRRSGTLYARAAPVSPSSETPLSASSSATAAQRRRRRSSQTMTLSPKTEGSSPEPNAVEDGSGVSKGPSSSSGVSSPTMAGGGIARPPTASSVSSSCSSHEGDVFDETRRMRSSLDNNTQEGRRRRTTASMDSVLEGDVGDALDDDDAGDTARRRRDSTHTCYVCCVARRNAVLMECGHGGVCFECAKALATRHPRCCPMCRQPIKAVYKVSRRDPEYYSSNSSNSRVVVADEGVVVRPCPPGGARSARGLGERGPSSASVAPAPPRENADADPQHRSGDDENAAERR